MRYVHMGDMTPERCLSRYHRRGWEGAVEVESRNSLEVVVGEHIENIVFRCLGFSGVYGIFVKDRCIGFSDDNFFRNENGDKVVETGVVSGSVGICGRVCGFEVHGKRVCITDYPESLNNLLDAWYMKVSQESERPQEYKKDLIFLSGRDKGTFVGAFVNIDKRVCGVTGIELDRQVWLSIDRVVMDKKAPELTTEEKEFLGMEETGGIGNRH